QHHSGSCIHQITSGYIGKRSTASNHWHRRVVLKIADGVRTCDDNPRKLRAVPAQHFDAALLSMVLRALRSKDQRRSLLRRAAESVRPGGLVVVVERTPLESMTDARFEGDFWTKIRLRPRRLLKSLRGTQVHLLDRLPDLAGETSGCQKKGMNTERDFW
ncbi:unnamed protein product, partial [Symbiodinium microadriaticum]